VWYAKRSTKGRRSQRKTLARTKASDKPTKPLELSFKANCLTTWDDYVE